MNLRAKFVISVGLLGLLSLLSSDPLRADTTYSYTGNAYTDCTGGYASGLGACLPGTALTITFVTSLTGSSLDDLNSDESPLNNTTITSVEISDGGSVIVNDESSNVGLIATFGTDDEGEINDWTVEVSTGLSSIQPIYETVESVSRPDKGFADDYSSYLTEFKAIAASGKNHDDPGSWVMNPVVSTPEPPNVLLLSFGLAVFGGLGWRRKILQRMQFVAVHRLLPRL
jgi:hypothetical protein